MMFSADMIDLIKIFEKRYVQYALVGGFAVNFYGYMRSTQDIDLLLYPSKENAAKIMGALNEFGFGNAGIPQSFFEKEGSAIHLGVEPNRIDLLTHLIGISNDTLFSEISRVEIECVTTNIISLKNLIKVKKSSDRLKDAADAEELEKIHRK